MWNFQEKKVIIFSKHSKQNDDGIRGKIMVNGKNVLLLNEETFWAYFVKVKNILMQAFQWRTLFCLYQKMPKALSCRFRIRKMIDLVLVRGGTMMLIYPAASKEQALEKLWDALQNHLHYNDGYENLTGNNLSLFFRYAFQTVYHVTFISCYDVLYRFTGESLL